MKRMIAVNGWNTDKLVSGANAFKHTNEAENKRKLPL